MRKALAIITVIVALGATSTASGQWVKSYKGGASLHAEAQ